MAASWISSAQKGQRFIFIRLSMRDATRSLPTHPACAPDRAQQAVAHGGTVLIAPSNEYRAKERFESMNVRISTKMARCIDDGRRERGTEDAWIDRREM